jgi:hypothetical protein
MEEVGVDTCDQECNADAQKKVVQLQGEYQGSLVLVYPQKVELDATS